MLTLTFLVQLFGATFLLLFAVRMVRTGIERAFGPSFKRRLTRGGSPLQLLALGVALAIILQSSAAVALLVSGFAGTGALGFFSGTAIVLGADLGSALLISVLSLNLQWLVPVLLTIGGILFLKSERRPLRQAGRIVLGVAFILIALRFLREAVDPIEHSSILPVLSGFLESDPLAAFLTGTALAFAMHSSVAAILMFVAVVGMGALPVGVGVSLVLGANLGSALIPLWLTRGAQPAMRRVPWANLVLRGSLALACLAAVAAIRPAAPPAGLGPGQALVLLHVIFNLVVVASLPAATFLERPLRTMLPDPPAPAEAPHHRSVLDPAALTSPVRGLACLRREVLRMTDVLEDMLTPLMPLYSDWDPGEARRIVGEDAVLNTALDDIRRYAAAMPHDEMSKAQMKTMRALVDYAIALEAAGDILAKRLVPLAEERAKKRLRLSKAGKEELTAIHARVLANLKSAATVLLSEDVEGARLLIEEKAEMGRLERLSRKKHLKRLSAGDPDSFASSDIHIETAYSLKEVNSWIVTVAHPILAREGQLLETRLVSESDDDAGSG